MSSRIKVLHVDDSAVVRQAIGQILKTAPDIELIGTAMDPIFAMQKMEKQWPDVILLDIEMPRMDGLTFLRKIMKEQPTPVVICSTLTTEGSDASIEALACGAIDIVCKPTLGTKEYLSDSSEMILNVIRAAAKSRVNNLRRELTPETTPKKLKADADVDSTSDSRLKTTTDKVVAIGCSTGGTQALEFIVSNLPRSSPGIVVVQHMPENFTRSFANRLNQLSELEIKEAESNDRVYPGRVLIARGGKHMLLKRSGAQYHVEVKEGPLVSRHCPSVDVLFRSVSKVAAKNALGIILTGMGDDGARGMKEMFDRGSHTISQDEASSVVFGMPKEAIALGGVKTVLSLNQVPRAIMQQFAA